MTCSVIDTFSDNNINVHNESCGKGLVGIIVTLSVFTCGHINYVT